jgi:hypothetical protein
MSGQIGKFDPVPHMDNNVVNQDLRSCIGIDEGAKIL